MKINNLNFMQFANEFISFSKLLRKKKFKTKKKEIYFESLFGYLIQYFARVKIIEVSCV